ncbi:inositol monophosphatase family protein [Streptomyces subrutilus]|uniref:3'(2'),5'-bisphosphate nucleotidase CysQ n=1 Tax=Streptomyces subrutilus TaxID=36818 RepID=A0A5P2UV68_9ACTN|nr:inositol monophosphatase family protein [Streptomyces subrutilus]QEU82115.1 3'(2'),5'-bisphosphate nucleotidase CysQ [Streptomyces subrutilus]WSJ28415.1 3'(2'),5'-bisphosphate nucleotidase CysQ [Streptomyces subrutilus]GGZ89032.1 inositol phosphatase [Streptomyces subrutilus]
MNTVMPFDADATLLSRVTSVVKAAGVTLRERHTPHARGVSLDQIVAEIHANDDAVLDVLRQPLLEARRGSRWAEDELAGGALPSGEWWVVDPAEGNINHVHGMDEWAVTATLVRDNQPVLTVVHLPLTGDTYTAVAGGGARLGDRPLQVSAKTELGGALVGTGQARPGEDERTFRRIGDSVTAMLVGGLVVRVSVPATMQLIHVAAGRTDAFWQFSDVRSGLVAGALLVSEAGGTVTDLSGEPWNTGSRDFLAAAPGIHTAALKVLSPIA